MSEQGVAKPLGITKAVFHWHVKNRNDMLLQMRDHWTHEITEVISENAEALALGAKSRLVRSAKMILVYDPGRYEIAIRQWALQDSTAARTVKKVNRKRLDFVTAALAELGFKGDELKMRAMLFVCYQTW